MARKKNAYRIEFELRQLSYDWRGDESSRVDGTRRYSITFRDRERARIVWDALERILRMLAWRTN